jgi:hypothetical protein
MKKHDLQLELYKACIAEAPKELMLSSNLDDEIEILQKYIGLSFNNMSIPQDLENKVKEIDYSFGLGFEKWFSDRINFYKNKWEEMTKYEGEILNSHAFMSKTFKILNKCSWWVQNAYQPFSGAKYLLHKLDCIAARFEIEKQNKEVLKKKAERFCEEEKDWRTKSQQKLNNKEREKERQIFAFFAELKAANELSAKGFQNVQFLEEGKNKTPDISAEKKGNNYYIEVKRIQNPREENEALRSGNIHSGVVNKNFRTALQKKIGDFVCDAKEKFKHQGNDLSKVQKVLVLDFEPGVDARLSVNFNATLVQIFGENYFSQLEQTHDITILPRKFF